MEKETGLKFIHDFIGQIPTIKDGLEPYPVSLRIINWIKFLAKHNISDPLIDRALFAQILSLSKSPEYHLLGNHLLENGFALLFSSVYFREGKFKVLTNKILTAELKEQILPDGGHFELSPMYHQLMLYRVLDCINLLQSNPAEENGELLDLLQSKASNMLGWLKQMTFSNGDNPLFNDATKGIAPESSQLFQYADKLNVPLEEVKLGESGYRRFDKGNYELILDAGQIGPDYIPGHAHCDMLSFCLYNNNKPFITDTGTSTYENNSQRIEERSTASHNTAMVSNQEQSEIWGAFRVGRRAAAFISIDKTEKVTASCRAYSNKEIIHTRTWYIKETNIEISDTINPPKLEATAHFHFHPDLTVSQEGTSLHSELGKLSFEGAIRVELDGYSFGEQFNHTKTGTVAIVHFRDSLRTVITV